MRVFEHFNGSQGALCPKCGTADDKETVLVSIDGTHEGLTVEAKQYHLDCIELTQTKLDSNIIVHMAFYPKV